MNAVTPLEENLEFGFCLRKEEPPTPPEPASDAPLLEQLARFREFGAATRLTQTKARLFSGETVSVPTCVNEFWTAKQRAANSLHEISYRACFKPQLPRFLSNA